MAKSFNSRSREGSDAVWSHAPRLHAKFQFTLPRGERLSYRRFHTYTSKFQFTLPRGERLCIARWSVLQYQVSIHAPARGATLSSSKAGRALSTFQFTLPRGERPASITDAFSTICFNSRSREGSDCLFIPVLYAGMFQFTLPRGERQPTNAAG